MATTGSPVPPSTEMLTKFDLIKFFAGRTMRRSDTVANARDRVRKLIDTDIKAGRFPLPQKHVYEFGKVVVWASEKRSLRGYLSGIVLPLKGANLAASMVASARAEGHLCVLPESVDACHGEIERLTRELDDAQRTINNLRSENDRLTFDADEMRRLREKLSRGGKRGGRGRPLKE